MDYRLNVKSLEDELREINQLQHFLGNVPMEPTHLDWFRRRAWVRSIHGTTHIEGNTLNDEEVDEVLSFGSADHSAREIHEILGTREALQLVDELASKSQLKPDEELIREIHRRVLKDINPLLKPGEYRHGENRVTDGEGNLIFSTPPSGDVPDFMQRFGGWLREGCDRHPAPISAALAHLELVAIHPFYDGNGRTSRALSRFLLRKANYNFGNLISLDAQLDHDRSAYFSAIRASIGRNYEPGYDATAFTKYFLSALAEASKFATRRLYIFQLVLQGLKKNVRKGELAAHAVDPLGFVWVNRNIRPDQYSEISGRSAQRTSEDLKSLVKFGYLDPALGQTRRRRHLPGPQLHQIGQRAQQEFEDSHRG